MMQVTFERYLQFFNEIFKTYHAHMRSHMSCSLTCIIRPLWFQRLVARLLVKMSQIRFDVAAASSFLLEASVPSLLGDLWSSSVSAHQGRKRPRSRPRGAACPETGHVRTELTGRRGFRELFSNLARCPCIWWHLRWHLEGRAVPLLSLRHGQASTTINSREQQRPGKGCSVT